MDLNQHVELFSIKSSHIEIEEQFSLKRTKCLLKANTAYSVHNTHVHRRYCECQFANKVETIAKAIHNKDCLVLLNVQYSRVTAQRLQITSNIRLRHLIR